MQQLYGGYTVIFTFVLTIHLRFTLPKEQFQQVSLFYFYI
jgi:hypothetical protein